MLASLGSFGNRQRDIGPDQLTRRAIARGFRMAV